MNFLALLPSLIQGGTGIAQLLGGLFGQPDRPRYAIPSAAKEAVNVSKNLAAQRKIPGQEIYETQLGENTAKSTQTLEKMGGSASAMGNLSNIYAQEAGARRNLAADAARYYAANQGQLQNALGNYARWQDKAWQKNVGDKYEEESAASSALTQAGMSNVFSGVSNVAGASAYNDLFKNMFGGNKSIPTKPLAGAGTFPGAQTTMTSPNQYGTGNYGSNYGNWFSPQGFTNPNMFNFGLNNSQWQNFFKTGF